jgi:hypothetical protein
VGTKLAGGTAVQLDKFEITVSDFEITGVTDKEITGRFNIEEK